VVRVKGGELGLQLGLLLRLHAPLLRLDRLDARALLRGDPPRLVAPPVLLLVRIRVRVRGTLTLEP